MYERQCDNPNPYTYRAFSTAASNATPSVLSNLNTRPGGRSDVSGAVPEVAMVATVKRDGALRSRQDHRKGHSIICMLASRWAAKGERCRTGFAVSRLLHRTTEEGSSCCRGDGDFRIVGAATEGME